MFTNEFDWDNGSASITTILDETGSQQDVQLIIADDGVYIRQFPDDDWKPADLICLTHKMFYDMVEALNHTEGFFVTKYTKK